MIPKTTAFPARLATNVGWVRGSLMVPERQRVLDVLNHHDGLLRLTDAFLPARKEHLGFFAVRVSSVSLVAPGAGTGDQRHAATLRSAQDFAIMTKSTRTRSNSKDSSGGKSTPPPITVDDAAKALLTMISQNIHTTQLLSLVGAAVGVIVSSSLSIRAIGRGLARTIEQRSLAPDQRRRSA